MRSNAVPRNWIGHVCEFMVASGRMPAWDAANYLTENLFGEAPNARLHENKAPQEAISFLLSGLYGPIADAVFRDFGLPATSSLHVFTDISLLGNSAVLVVYFPGPHKRPQLLLLDAVRAWNLVFPDALSFNGWAQRRYREISSALQGAIVTEITEARSSLDLKEG